MINFNLDSKLIINTFYLLLLIVLSCNSIQYIEISGETMGTTYSIKIINESTSNINIDDFIIMMNAEGMEVRQSGNRPLHQLPLFNSKQLNKSDYPNCETFYNSSLSLPTFTLEDISLIDEYVLAFKKVCNILSKHKIDLK